LSRILAVMVLLNSTAEQSLSPNHPQHSKSLIDPSDMLHLIFGTSSLHQSKFVIQITHPPLS